MLEHVVSGRVVERRGNLERGPTDTLRVTRDLDCLTCAERLRADDDRNPAFCRVYDSCSRLFAFLDTQNRKLAACAVDQERSVPLADAVLNLKVHVLPHPIQVEREVIIIEGGHSEKTTSQLVDCGLASQQLFRS